MYNKHINIAFFSRIVAFIDIMKGSWNVLESYYQDADYGINYSHIKSENPPGMDFHLHERFEIYFFISGKINYFVEKEVYSLKHGDLLLMNSHEIHKPSFRSGEVYERIVIHFDPNIPRLFNPSGYDLLSCFVNRPRGEQNRIRLDSNQIHQVHGMLMKIEELNSIGSDESRVLKLT